MAEKKTAPKARRGYKKDGTPARKGVKGKTTTGKVHNVKADQSNWRRHLQISRIKFDDDQKELYCQELAEHGLKGKAAEVAGVVNSTVNGHIKNDPEFAEMVEVALERYRDKVVSHHTDLLFNGEVHKTYDKDGNVLSEKHVYPVQLILAELRKVDPAYRDKSDLGLGALVGGVLIAPAEQTPQEWIAEQKRLNDLRDQEKREETA